MEELKLLRKIADETKTLWDKGLLRVEAITLKNLLTDRIDFETRKEKEQAVEADAKGWCRKCDAVIFTEDAKFCQSCGEKF